MPIELQEETGLTEDQRILKEARSRFRLAVDAEREIREEARKDLQFLAGDQWDPKVKHDRDLAGRPALTFNKLPTYVQQVSNQARQNKPAVKVHPVDTEADPDTATVLQGIIRHVEYDSNADSAYDTALQYAASCGFGYFGFTTEYCDPETFDQDIKVRRFPDPEAVYLDPFCQEPDGSDAMYGFVVDKMSTEEFELKYGAIEYGEFSSDYWGDLSEEEWVTDESVRIAEYWRIEVKKRKLRMLRGEDGIPAKVYTDQEGYDPEANYEKDRKGNVREREVEERTVCQYLINGARVLEKNEWPGKWIPIVRVLGQELYVRGKRMLFSLIRFVRDPQQLLNFYKTTEAETISLAPRPKWVGAVGQFKSKKGDWQRANVANLAYLEYDAVTVNGAVAPPPHWETFEPPVQALSIGSAQCVDDIKAGTGIFDASLGSQARETSGVAIQKRKVQSDVSNFHFIDNLSRAQRFGGRIMLDLIPQIYDTARQVRVIGEDERARVVKVNTAWTDEKGKAQHYRLDLGKYDLVVSSEPSYATRRLEAFDLLTQMAQGDPEIMAIGGDIIFRNSDIPGGDELADRWRRMIALSKPGVITDDTKKDIPPGVQMQLTQGEQMMQALNQKIQELTQIIQTKQVESASKERIAELQAASALDVAQIKAGFTAATQQFIQDMKAAHEAAMAAAQSEHEAGQADADRTHQRAMQSQNQTHEAGMQQADQGHEAAIQAQDQAHQVGMQDQAQEHQAGLQGEQLQAQADQAKLAAKKPGPKK